MNNLLQSLNQKLKMLSYTNQHVIAALQKQPQNFEDALLYEIALHHQLDYFITSNVKDVNKIKSAQLPVLRPKDFNKLLL